MSSLAGVQGTQRPAPVDHLIGALDLGTTSTCFEIDGVSSLRCLCPVVIPLTKPSLLALFVLMFVYGCNQYLWALLITAYLSMYAVSIGLVRMLGTSESLPDWDLGRRAPP